VVAAGPAQTRRARAPFAAIVGSGDHVAAAGEHHACNAAAQRLKKGELAFGEDKIDHVAAQSQIVHGVNVRRVRSKSAERFIQRPRVGRTR
jgi:hypothetical protein